ncbi:MAG TPA: flagellar hook-basal body complex protein [Thermoguttaceae bacterium]|nr:flagellar hook-basal body complex protein [Thermoguttaceae bacterium]
MGLASALSTALTGLTAAETTIDVVGNNLANSNTVGFKASQVNFATQFLQTRSLGSAPTANDGGRNPRQIGLGTMVADITPNFNQGTIQLSSSPTDLAIQGDGFFIVQGGQGEQLYTRNGIFKMNSESELTTTTGNRLLGFGVDDDYQIDSGTLMPIHIPIGAAAVAQATSSVFLEGTLSPTGDLATTAEIIQTAVLGDNSYTAPTSTGMSTTITQLVPATTTTSAGSFGIPGVDGLTPNATYSYELVFYDPNTDTEGQPSTVVSDTLGAAENQFTLDNLPDDASSTYTRLRIYRSEADQTDAYYLIHEQDVGAAAPPHIDQLSDADLTDGTHAQLNQTLLAGSYNYLIMFYNSSTGVESRPTQPVEAGIIDNRRFQLRDLPVDASGQWDTRRIYRNTNTNPNTYYRIGEIADATTPGLVYTDSTSDTEIASDPAAHPQCNLDGPPAANSTLVTDLLLRDENGDYDLLFQEGTLDFTARKGGRSLSAKQFEITATTTLPELVNFMQEAMGIQEPTADNGIPNDGGSGNPPGGVITGGRIQFIGNNGEDNAIDIGVSGLQLTPAGGSPVSVDIPFSSVQSAVGESASADFLAYDTLGIPLQVRVTAVLESRDSSATVYRWFADSPDNDPASGVNIAVGTGLIYFNGEGNVSSVSESTVSVRRETVSSITPLEFELDFSSLSGLSADESSLAVSRQDGSGPGVLSSFIVGEDGRIKGVFSNGITRDLGQVQLVRFGNPTGLHQKGENLFATGVNSGLPVMGNPGQQGIGTVIAGAQELSNTDIGSNLIDLILASTMYRGNTRVITTSQQMLDELLALRR